MERIRDQQTQPHVSESKTLDPIKLNLLDGDSEKVKRDFIQLKEQSESFKSYLESTENHYLPMPVSIGLSQHHSEVLELKQKQIQQPQFKNTTNRQDVQSL